MSAAASPFPHHEGAIRFVYRERGRGSRAFSSRTRFPVCRTALRVAAASGSSSPPCRMSTGSSTSSSSSTGAAARSGSSTRRIHSARQALGARSRCSSFAATGHLPGSTPNRWALSKPLFYGAASCAPTFRPCAGAIRRPTSAARSSSPTTARSTPTTPPSYAARPAGAAPRRPACADRPKRDLFGLRPVRARSRRGAPARIRAGTAPDRRRREPRRPLAPARASPLSRELRRALPPVGELLPPARSPRIPLPPLRPDRPLHRQRARRTGRAADSGHDRLRHDRGQLPGERRDVRGAAAARLRRALPALSRRAQLGGVARQLPPAPRAADRTSDLT